MVSFYVLLYVIVTWLKKVYSLPKLYLDILAKSIKIVTSANYGMKFVPIEFPKM